MSAFDYIQNIFNFGRESPFPAIYHENKTPVTVDVLEVGWIVAFFTAYFSFLLLLPAAVGKEKALYFIRITLISFIGLIVMLCNFGQEWEVGKIESKMFYKAGSHEEIDGSVGVKLGLRSVNITLKANSATLRGDLAGENINYNERFSWTWAQGRAGFGPFAGRIQQEFREAQLRGAPYPILWVAEYFTFDGEGIRFGRHYRHAGWYAHICVWSAFVCWLLSLILFKIYIRYGAIMISLVGCFLLTASLIWCSFRNFNELSIVFNNDDTHGVLRTYYGVHWYLALFVGLFCIVAGGITVILDIYFHNSFCKFFGVDPYAIIDEDYGEWEDESNTKEKGKTEDMELTTTNAKRDKRKTVVYKARGTKRHWKNQINETIHDNAKYFTAFDDNTMMDPEYLHAGYYEDNQLAPANVLAFENQPNLGQNPNIYSNMESVQPNQYYPNADQNQVGYPYYPDAGQGDPNVQGYYAGGQQVDGQYNMGQYTNQNFDYDPQMQFQSQQGSNDPQVAYTGNDAPPIPPRA